MQFVNIKFEGGSNNLYTFRADNDIYIDDLVVCDTANGYKVGQVVDLIPAISPSKINKWVVCKIDLSAYRAKLEAEARLGVLKAKMEIRRKQLEQKAVYDMLAKGDAEMQALLEEYKAVQNPEY